MLTNSTHYAASVFHIFSGISKNLSIPKMNQGEKEGVECKVVPATEGDQDRNLIIRSQNGEKQAYGMLVKKYMQRAYFIAFGLIGSHEAALDLSQEAFVRAYRAIHKLDANRKFYTWYYQILKNLCFNFLRDRTRHARSFTEVGETVLKTVPDSTQDVSLRVEQEEMKEVVWKALNSLKAHEKEIIILKDFQELAYKEIAELLHCPIGTVMSRLYNARKALKAKLLRYIS